MSVQELVNTLESTRESTVRRFGGIDPARLEEERSWRGAPSTLRFLFNWLSEGTQSRRLRILRTAEQLGRRLSEAQQAVVLLGAARGRLRGALLCVPDEICDRAPAEGEWNARQLLGHVIATDERYRLAVEYAVQRQRSGGEGPLRPSESSLPARTGEAQAVGTPAELRRRLWEERSKVIETLAAIPDDLLSAPTGWISWDIDVRFRIHRFAAHDREHTIQLQKAQQALGIAPSEPQLLLGDAMVELEALEGILVSIGDGTLDQTPPDGGPAISALVRESIEEEQALVSIG
jgi:hypothetical protein